MPTGIPEKKWAPAAGPASLPIEDLASGYCQAVTPCHVALLDSLRNCSCTIGIADANIARNVDGGVVIC